MAVMLVGCGQGDMAVPPDTGADAQRLIAAARAGDASAIDRELAAGADVNARDARGQTAVTAAALAEDADAVRVLVDAGADVNLQDEDRNNALLVSGETGNVEVLREVLRGDPDPTRTNRFGGTALIPASDRGHVETVRELLRTDIDVNHINDLGWTALLEAVVLGEGGAAHQEIVRMLVDAGADVDLADRDDVTPLEHARSRGYVAIAAALEQAGAGKRAE